MTPPSLDTVMLCESLVWPRHSAIKGSSSLGWSLEVVHGIDLQVHCEGKSSQYGLVRPTINMSSNWREGRSFGRLPDEDGTEGLGGQGLAAGEPGLIGARRGLRVDW